PRNARPLQRRTSTTVRDAERSSGTGDRACHLAGRLQANDSICTDLLAGLGWYCGAARAVVDARGGGCFRRSTGVASGKPTVIIAGFGHGSARNVLPNNGASDTTSGRGT